MGRNLSENPLSNNVRRGRRRTVIGLTSLAASAAIATGCASSINVGPSFCMPAATYNDSSISGSPSVQEVNFGNPTSENGGTEGVRFDNIGSISDPHLWKGTGVLFRTKVFTVGGQNEETATFITSSGEEDTLTIIDNGNNTTATLKVTPPTQEACVVYLDSLQTSQKAA